MYPSLVWEIGQLSPLIDLLSEIVSEPGDVIALAERAGAPSPKSIPREKTAPAQWQEVMKDAINQGYLENLTQQAQAKVKGKSEEIFRQRLQEVGALRLRSLVGKDYVELNSCVDRLLEAEHPRDQYETAANLRRTVLRLRKALDEYIPWQALTPVETSVEEIHERRGLLVVLCVNIIGATEYALTLIKPMCTPEAPLDPQGARMYLVPREREPTGFSDDLKLRRAIDARMTVALEARKLWYALKENVTLPPDGPSNDDGRGGRDEH
jgi:hypothetical protein